MKQFLLAVKRLDITCHTIAGIVLAFMMLVTLGDVFMRNIGHPIVGTVELISFCGSVVVGFAIPYASWMKVHVYVDILITKLNTRNRMIMSAMTRVLAIALFIFIGYNFILYGLDLKNTHEVSAGLKLPYYPIPFGLSFSCFLQAVTLFADFVKTVKGGDYE
ncbi:MAG TPA: TRAP transporter small permease [Syntrophorhabdaceae bacterium]|jgi:TRAP-type C4-dicarboxylate transport system permease small subunit